MCGIIGYTGHRPAVPVVIEGLRRLEYRGYDSAGVGFVQGRELHILRAAGKLRQLENKLASCGTFLATSAIGHTRWATHGAPTEANAHPHKAFRGGVCLVHNGIFENYAEHKQILQGKGCVFSSETDTEVLVNLVADERVPGVSLLEAFALALRKAQGAYAVALMDQDEPDVLYAARHSAPLLLGIGRGENYVASDIPAFLPYTRDVVFLEDGEIVRITPASWQIFSLADLMPVSKSAQRIDWDMQSAQKDGFRHFMLKEIFEQPRAIAECMAGRTDASRTAVRIPEMDALPVPSRLRIIACGTSFHAGLWILPLLEEWAGIPTNVEIASEFRYRKPLLAPGETTLVISQSGETADTLAALRIARERHSPVIGLCNVVGSSIARETDAVIFTQAGPEISVASTKALCSQMLVLLLMALYWGQRQNSLPKGLAPEALRALDGLPAQLETALPVLRTEARALAWQHASARSMFFLGRGQSYPLALEGALKVKELSYIHAEGYAAGEMKHGPIALIEPDFPSFFLAPHDALFAKSRSNLEEVQARRGPVVVLTNSPKPGLHLDARQAWIIPDAWGPLKGFFFLPALQLFSYEAATYLGKDVDQPRNLAKSVTVE
ncbi:MAG: glutamine--fructose-6-phosphate transaminase (isomerizing) [Desulfovibrio sp.]|jgi:glucosamine--fructose-6-phosphate aminotransferase (isomerizing)|nr:glutamine--fructose-6-phosphate transaminase (isomerizing) [Desulfovibrio sp.]